MSLFNRRNQNEFARQNPAFGPPASLGESMTSSYNEALLDFNSLTFEEQKVEAFDRYIDQVAEVSGQRLVNPLLVTPSMTEAPVDVKLEDQRVQDFFDQVTRIRKDHPDLPATSYDQMLQDIARERQQIRETRADVARREGGFASAAASFVGATGAVLTDPLTLSSMAFGAPTGAGILRFALTEAGIAAGAEVGVQSIVQAQRTQIPGEEPSIEEAARNVLFAGAGGGAGAAGLRGLFSGTRALTRASKRLPQRFRTREVRAAEKYLERKADIEDANPFPDSEGGMALHRQLFDDAVTRLSGLPTRRGQLTGSTAVRQVFQPGDPLVRVEETIPLARGEDVDDYIARLRETYPRDFEALDKVDTRIADIRQRMEKIDEALGAPPSRLEELEAQLANTTDKRKIKRLQRNINDLLEKGGPKTERTNLTKRQRSRLTTERNKLAKELKTREAERTRAVEQVDQRIRQTPALTQRRPEFRLRELLPGEAQVDRAVRRIAEAIGEVAQDVPANAPLTRAPAHRAQVIPDDEVTPAMTRQEAEVIDEQLRNTAEEAGDELIDIVGDDGQTRTLTMRELVQEFEDEESLITVMQTCVRSTL